MDRLPIFLLVSFGVGALLTPVMARLSFRLGIIDNPSTRKFHLTSMPMMGGVAVISAFMITAPFAIGAEGMKQYWAVFAATLLMAGFGLADDVRDISPAVKLAGQVAATIILMAGGLMWRASGIQIIDIGLTFLWVCGITNALNLLDNIDGLSSGTTAITAVFFAIAGVFGGLDTAALLPVVLAGAAMGFLFHNFHPATIFLGDAGSMAVGTLLAAFGMMIPDGAGPLNRIAAAVILGLLVFDTGLVSILRLANGRSLARGGKDHTSHRLCNLGLSVQGSVITLFGVNFFFGCCALIMLELGHPRGLVIPFGLFLIALMCVYLFKDTYNYRKENR